MDEKRGLRKMKVAIYCRLSEEDKNKQTTEDSESIQNQKNMLIQYAVGHGWDIFKIYSDDDYTGADRKRPEFTKLIIDAKAHLFDIILCKSQSRFTRELELVEKYIHGLFPIWNIRFISIVDNADTAVKGNKKARQINGLINEWYLEEMSENIKSVFDAKRNMGYHIGAFALYGYEKDPDRKGHLIIDKEAAKIVQEVFALYSQGYGKTAIARLLNDRGIPNPTEYKRRKGLRYQQPKAKNSTLWKYFNISEMLANQMYIGNMVQGKYGSISYKTKKNRPRPVEQWFIVENTHEAIIEKELWEKVQSLRKQKAKPFITGEIGLFAGKARCVYCGYAMASTKSHNKHYLMCSSRHIAKDACIGSFISVDKLEQAVCKELNKLLLKYLDKKELEQDMEFVSGRKRERLKLALTVCQKKEAEFAKGMKDAYFDKIKGILTEQEYVEFSKEFSEKKKEIEEQISSIKIQIEEMKQKIQEEKKKDASCYIGFLSREMVDKFIDSIQIGKKDSITKTVPVKIYWNF